MSPRRSVSPTAGETYQYKTDAFAFEFVKVCAKSRLCGDPLLVGGDQLGVAERPVVLLHHRHVFGLLHQ